MNTRCIQVDPARPDPAAIEQAAAILRAGGLVAFPTETVYGLGANALDAAAVARVFAAKGRPPTNPVIVHVSDTDQAAEIAQWSDAAEKLARRYWPGPLTLVLPKRDIVPDNVAGGGPTVAVRAPGHAVALALIGAARVPLAAPSANPSSHVSATRAEHVLRRLSGKVDLVLDGGPAPGGIESTVLSLATSPPQLLRRGLIDVEQIEAVIGPIEVAAPCVRVDNQAMPSPGLLERHYAPLAHLMLDKSDGRELVHRFLAAGRRVGWMPIEPVREQPLEAASDRLRLREMPLDPVVYAARLYEALHDLDAWGAEVIVVQRPPEAEPWLAIIDRLTRAAAHG